MQKKGFKALLCSVAIVGLLAGPSCYGPFRLTKQVHKFNGNFEEKWVSEVVFLGCIILPVYGLAMLGDGLIFNSIEFWGGKNPIEPVKE